MSDERMRTRNVTIWSDTVCDTCKKPLSDSRAHPSGKAVANLEGLWGLECAPASARAEVDGKPQPTEDELSAALRAHEKKHGPGR